MRRAPFVVGGTAAGLALVLSFHTSSPSGVGVAAGAPGGAGPATPPTTSAAAASAPPNAARSTSAAPVTTAPPSTTTTAPSARSATGQAVYYRYGLLQLRVSVSGGHITNISRVQDEATDPRSAEINAQAIPMLHDQAVQAQSANIDGVSGATYTSEAYVQSLQSALDQLGWKG